MVAFAFNSTHEHTLKVLSLFLTFFDAQTFQIIQSLFKFCGFPLALEQIFFDA